MRRLPIEIPSLDAIKQEKAKRHLIDFMLYDGRGNWQSARHLAILCDALERVERGELKRLMVFMPPRHGKSEVDTKKFPAWYLGRNPTEEMIICSYAADLAYDFSRIARETFREHGPEIWGVQLAKESGAVGRWGISGYRGGLTAAGVGGPITGRGGKVILVDDPFKNYEEAASDTIREKVWQWYLSTLRTRLAPGGAIVLVMTRWHEDDLAGRLLKQMAEGGEEWEVISLPAEAEEDDPLDRQPGEWLWPERYSAAEYEALKKTLGSYLWAALYQQRPMPAEGGLFKRAWFRYFKREDDFYALIRPDGEHRVRVQDCFVFQTIDLAASLKNTADYFVISTWALTPELDILLLDVFRDRVEGPEQRQHLLTQFNRWGAKLVGIESTQYQLTFLQEARRMGLPSIELHPSKDKFSRALPMSARYEAGTVYHLQGGHYQDSYENELLSFPNGEHDDQVDTASVAGEFTTTWGKSRTGIAPDEVAARPAPKGTVAEALGKLKKEREEDERW